MKSITEKVSLEETKSFASSSSRGAIVDGENDRPEIPSIARIVKARDARTRAGLSGNQNKPGQEPLFQLEPLKPVDSAMRIRRYRLKLISDQAELSGARIPY